jgi:hypothetical protein
VPEHEQGVPEEEIDEHASLGRLTLKLAGGAVAAIALATRFTGLAAGALSGLGLALQLAAAITVGLAGFEGGKLVYDHGANVKVDGKLVKSADADSIKSERERRRAERRRQQAEGQGPR